jgi:hypothetical protein
MDSVQAQIIIRTAEEVSSAELDKAHAAVGRIADLQSRILDHVQANQPSPRARGKRGARSEQG